MSSTRPVFVQYFEIVLKTLCSSNRINGDMQWNTTYIPKTDQPSFSQIEDFRSIAVLNVQEKLSCSLISKRLEKHIIANNKFINTSVHNGCMGKAAGSWEHMSKVWGALKESQFLARIIDGSLSDRKSISELEKKLLSGLKLIERSLFKGVQKILTLQHLLVPRIQGPLIIYEISISAATNLEKKTSTYIRKWLGLHSSTTNISLYSCSPCPLPVKKLTAVLKSS